MHSAGEEGRRQTGKYLLLGIDLEDVRLRMERGQHYQERVPTMTERYLAYFRDWNIKTTFFTVGDVAEMYPSLIKDIVVEGHEIACHSYQHLTLDCLDKETFSSDIEKNLNALYQAGAAQVHGFRAPVASLTEATAEWAYPLLENLGFLYSSSVLPAPNPLYGWPMFGTQVRSMGRILEIPMSIFPSRFFQFPFMAGTYFRVLPYWAIHAASQNIWSKGQPVIGYLHPYDIDTGQERYMHPGIHDSLLYNYLMYARRGSVFPKLTRLLEDGAVVIPYLDYVQQIALEEEESSPSTITK